MPAPRFIHLRVHSAYSMLEGAIAVKAMPKLCAAQGVPAMALTDTNNLFGALEFSEVMAKAGLQPIIGVQLTVRCAEPGRPGEPPAESGPVVLLAQSEAGYLNLMKLVSRAYLVAETPEASMRDLAAYNEGLICLSGGAEGPAGRLLRGGRVEAARGWLKRMAEVFPDRFYIELQRHGDPLIPEQAETEPFFLEIAYAQGMPLVATNDAYFPDQAMHEAHDALICIAEGRYVSEKDRRRLTPEHHLKSPEAMAERFADLPEALANTIEIARRCAYRPLKRKPILPRFADNEVAELQRQSREGLAMRLETRPPTAERAVYEERLEFELGVIEKMGFPGYFLIVADFIKWAKEQEIPVGPGRGSGAGSLVAYALTITDLDPLRYNLLFERFLNPERVSMPDFDIDFCQDRREEVIRYVQERYGYDQVAQIITFGTLQARAAIRDVGRVLQMPYGQVDRLCKLMPYEGVKPVPIPKAVEQEPRLQDEIKREPTVEQMFDIGEKVEGLLRNASTHAAGVVIGDRPLDQLVPLYRDPRSDMPVTQFNMKWVEEAGLVKFDFLGLKTLTVIQGAIDLLRAEGAEFLEPEELPLNDKATYELYCTGDTVGVFQVESAGMRDALRQLQPDCIEDIIALVALYRPGPMDNIPKYCATKNGLEDADYLHPKLEPILKETYGIIVYQEQVMQIAQVLAGYSLGGADLLRRAMGKKIKEAMDAERPKFVDGAKARGVGEAKAVEIWNLLEKFANYGFNKSHAAAYAVVSYQTAYYKAHHPAAFLAAAMNLDLHLTDKLSVFKQDADRLKIPILPPDVNRSQARFSLAEGGLAYALGGLKNVGVEAMAALVREREANGPFKDVFDLMARIDPRQINKRTLETLIKAGALDGLDPNRRLLHDNAETLLAYAQAAAADRGGNQASLFGEAGDQQRPRLKQVDDWPAVERLGHEHAAVGFYLSGHPLDDYMPALRRKRALTYTELVDTAGGRPMQARLAGTVAGRQERKSQKGNRFAFVQLSDPSAMYEVTVFSETLAQNRDLLEPGESVVLAVEASNEGGMLRLRVNGVQRIDDAVADAASSGLRVFVREAAAFEAVRAHLAAGADAPKRAQGPVELVINAAEAQVRLSLPPCAVDPRRMGALKALPGVSVEAM